jgi:DNA-binding NarL/FixJ family response regulator
VIRVLIADDQGLVRQGLAALLKLERDIEVVAQAADGEEAHRLALELRPDIVLMDLRMPKCDGVAATKFIRTALPQTRVLVLTTFDDDESIAGALEAGASGYLLKDVESEKLADTIRSVQEGFTQLGPTVSSKLSALLKAEKKELNAELKKLTEREVSVLDLIAQGKSNKEIAAELCLTEGTVKNYVTHILTILNLRDRTQIAIWAHQNVRR